MTITINLLPWRQTQRAEETRETTSLMQGAFGVGLIIGGIFCLHFYFKAKDAAQAVDLLKQEIQVSDKKLIEITKYKSTKDALIARMKVVHQLQSSRILTVHLLDELVQIMLDGIYLISVQRIGDRVLVHGYAESNTYVSQLMRNIEKSQWIDDPVLTEIKRDEKELPKGANTTSEAQTNEFQLSFTVRSKQLEAEEKSLPVEAPENPSKTRGKPIKAQEKP